MPDALLKGGKRKWDKFLHARHLFRPQTCGKRIAASGKAGEWKIPRHVAEAKSRLALARCRQLQVLERQLCDYRARIERLFASHPDSGTFGSLPGAGPKLAPRLLSEIGSDRDLFADAGSLQCLAGTAPASHRSGQISRVKFRRACNKHLRSAVHHLAARSMARCPWAATYYEALRRRGKSHACALRCLGQRRLKIIWRIWQDTTAYDGERHMKNQIAHGSWVLAITSPTAT